MIEASCHCGSVRLEAPVLPDCLTECTCSICRRLGAKWAYYTQGEVAVHAKPNALKAYVWGDRCIEFYHCTFCGCSSHYESVEKTPDSRLAIDARGFEASRIAGLKVRVFDGADTWEYLNE